MKAFYCLPALLCPVLQAIAQPAVTGVVHTKTNTPLSNITVALKGSHTRTLTNASGVFSLVLRQPADTLLVTAVGYQQYQLSVAPTSGFLDITLQEATAQLDEVVVIGYGTTTQRYSTGSVATVSGADIAKQPVMNPLAALEGRVPGLSITQNSGVPGSSFAVQVRGQNSLTQGSEPLFVIDGVPYAPNNTAVNQLSSAAAYFNSGLSPFSSLNPADIESVTILKDADATAIYGSRGANGVVLITTKKGGGDKTGFTLNAYTGQSKAISRVHLLNTRQYLSMRREAFANDGVTPTAANAPDLLLWDTTRYTNFQQLLIGGIARTTDVQASLTGGSANTRFLLSGAFHRETTVFPGNHHDTRGSAHASLTHTSNNRKLSLSLSVLYSSDVNAIPVADLTSYTRLAPDMPALKDSAGALVWNFNGITLSNPLATSVQPYRAETGNLLGNASLSYRLLPGLTLRVSSGYNRYQLSEVTRYPIQTQNPLYNPQGTALFGNNMLQSWIIEPGAEYNASLHRLQVNVIAGGTVQQNNNERWALRARGYTNDQLLGSYGGAQTISVTASDASQYRYTAGYGRINLSWAHTYILNLSGRRDGSSRFGPGRQFANFGAVGAAWLFSGEQWLQKALPFLSYGKLRGSYGTTGNDQIGNYHYLNSWSPVYYPYSGIAGLYPTRLYNPVYGWEINRKAEIGLELGFLHDRILLTTNYYRNRSSNQLVNYNLPLQTGFSSILSNFPATVQNTGWEWTLTAKPVAAAHFTWSATLTLTVPRNKLVAFPGLATSEYASQYEVGQPVTIVKGMQFTGVNPQTGLFTFADLNKDGIADYDDQAVIADLSPKYYGGWQHSLSWKGWELDIFFQFKRGTGVNQLAKIYGASLVPPGGFLNQPQEVLGRWQQPGDITAIQQFTATPGTAAYSTLDYLSISSAVYSDASYIRLKNAAISYALPLRLTGWWHITGLRLYLQGQNLLTISRYQGSDPETQNLLVLPPLRTLTAGIQFIL